MSLVKVIEKYLITSKKFFSKIFEYEGCLPGGPGLLGPGGPKQETKRGTINI